MKEKIPVYGQLNLHIALGEAEVCHIFPSRPTPSLHMIHNICDVGILVKLVT
jgi:hypothetical protein